MQVRELTAKDVPLWKEIRLKALKECPEAYGASYKEQKDCEDDFFLKQIKETTLFGAFEDVQTNTIMMLFYISYDHELNLRDCNGF